MSFCVFMIPFLLSSALLKEVKMLMFSLVMNILKDKKGDFDQTSLYLFNAELRYHQV